MNKKHRSWILSTQKTNYNFNLMIKNKSSWNRISYVEILLNFKGEKPDNMNGKQNQLLFSFQLQRQKSTTYTRNVQKNNNNNNNKGKMKKRKKENKLVGAKMWAFALGLKSHFLITMRPRREKHGKMPRNR